MATVDRALDKVKILVLGDSGVGKTSLVHLIAKNAPLKKPSWTMGCSVEVKLHEYKEGTPHQKSFFIEMWDVGGHPNHENSRGVFYNPFNGIHGILLVHDLTNRKSESNLKKWLAEVFQRDQKVQEMNEFDIELYADRSVPILIVGTKLDIAESVRTYNANSQSSITDELLAEEIRLDCLEARSINVGSSNLVKLTRFFDKVIENKINGFFRNSPAVVLPTESSNI